MSLLSQADNRRLNVVSIRIMSDMVSPWWRPALHGSGSRSALARAQHAGLGKSIPTDWFLQDIRD